MEAYIRPDYFLKKLFNFLVVGIKTLDSEYSLRFNIFLCQTCLFSFSSFSKLQAVPVKSEANSEQAAKRHKAEPSDDVAKAVAPRPTNHAAIVAPLDSVKLQDKKNPAESPVSPSTKTNSTMLQQSPRSLKQPSRLPSLINRFKLDNRTTTFRILPPLPADIANVAVLKEHFSSFGDVPTVELEHLEDHVSSPGSKSSCKCSARITFTTRRSAERAFQNGRCCQGHNLQLNWSTNASNLSNDHNGMEMSRTPTPRGPDARVLAESSSLHAENLIGSGVPQATDNSQNQDSTEGQNDDLDHLTRETAEVLPSSSPPISSNEQLHESDDPVAED